jgi:hypothetical protein
VRPRASLNGIGKHLPDGIRSPNRPAHSQSLYPPRCPSPMPSTDQTKTEIIQFASRQYEILDPMDEPGRKANPQSSSIVQEGLQQLLEKS